MKIKQFLVSLIILSSIMTMNAQWSGVNPLSTSSKVGIGITTLPSGQLDVWRPASNGVITRFATLFDNGQGLDLKAIQTSTGNGYISLDNSVNSPGWQKIVIPNGSVGIGTVSPIAPLEVRRDASNGIVTRFVTNLDGGQGLDLKAIQTSTGNGYISLDNSASTPNWQKIVIPNGFFGIGTVSPIAPLEVRRDASNGIVTRFVTNLDGGQGLDIKATQTSTGNGYISLDNSASTPNWQKIVIPTGSVGIGTTNPDSRFKLDVEGSIRATEVRVCLQGGCDFVFEKDYKLMNLNELEKFVTTKQHLPEIASEKEMIENGLNMKEFQMKLLQKVEELTLYVIEQNTKSEKQEQELKKLKAKIKKIESTKR
jgi:hypothetical protein